MNLRRKSCGVQGDLFYQQREGYEPPRRLTALIERRSVLKELIKEWGKWDDGKYTSFDQSFKQWLSRYPEVSFKDVDGMHDILRKIQAEILFLTEEALRELGKL